MNLIDEIRDTRYRIREIKMGPFWIRAETKGEKLARVSFFHKKESLSVSGVNVSGASKGKIMNFPLLDHLQEDLINYWRGEKINFSDYPLKLDNYSPFAKKVWMVIRKIPYGKVRSYKWIAEKIHTKGYRAIGGALARNPFLIIIPCHRVLREDGSLGGYSPGLEIKRKLLEIEGV